MSVRDHEVTVSVRAAGVTCDGCGVEWSPSVSDIKEVRRAGPDAILTAVGIDAPVGWNPMRAGGKRLDLCVGCGPMAILARRRELAAAVAPPASAAVPATATASAAATADEPIRVEPAATASETPAPAPKKGKGKKNGGGILDLAEAALDAIEAAKVPEKGDDGVRAETKVNADGSLEPEVLPAGTARA